VPVAPRAGDAIATSATGMPPLAGTVDTAEGTMITMVLDEPAPGVGFIGAGGAGEEVFTIVRAQLFGPEAAEIAAHQQTAWESWFAGRRAHSATS